jgi:hypothetical protein
VRYDPGSAGRTFEARFDDRPWAILGEIRGTLQSYVEEALERYADNCRSALLEMDSILSEKPFQFFTGGAHNVLGLPDFNDLGRLQTIMALLEEEDSIGRLVRGCSAEKGLCVTIGDENPVLQMRDCSIVMASTVTGGRKAVVGLIALSVRTTSAPSPFWKACWTPWPRTGRAMRRFVKCSVLITKRQRKSRKAESSCSSGSLPGRWNSRTSRGVLSERRNGGAPQ